MASQERDDATRFKQMLPRLRSGLPGGGYIHSGRILRLLDTVWLRLPELDRHVLGEMTDFFTDDPAHIREPERVYGSAGPFMGEVLIDGVGCVLPEDAMIFLNAKDLLDLSDAAAMAIIAHELAHVLLRHSCLSHPLTVIEKLRADELERQGEIHEWEADFQVWLWGFTSEMRAAWEELEREPPPWYHQIEEPERT